MLEVKQQLTDPGFTDKSGALQASIKIGKQTPFSYHHSMKILSSDALPWAKK